MFVQGLPDHLRYIGCGDFDIAIASQGCHWCRVGSIEFCLGYHVFLQHILQPRLASRNGTLRIGQGIAARGTGQQGNHHSGFCQAEVARVLSVIDIGRSTNPICAGTKINGIQVQSQNLFAGQLSLNLQGEGNLLEFAQVDIVTVK